MAFLQQISVAKQPPARPMLTSCWRAALQAVGIPRNPRKRVQVAQVGQQIWSIWNFLKFLSKGANQNSDFLWFEGRLKIEKWCNSSPPAGMKLQSWLQMVAPNPCVLWKTFFRWFRGTSWSSSCQGVWSAESSSAATGKAQKCESKFEGGQGWVNFVGSFNLVWWFMVIPFVDWLGWNGFVQKSGTPSHGLNVHFPFEDYKSCNEHCHCSCQEDHNPIIWYNMIGLWLIWII